MNEYSKRYWWLKLSKDFFKRHDIRIIEGMPNGKDYVLFYMKLLCESIDHEGRLRFSERIPYTNEMLATITNTNVDVARTAMELLVELGLAEIYEDGTIFMTEIPEMTGSETGMAKYQRERRLAGDTLTLGMYENVKMTKKELGQLKEFYPSYWASYIERLSEYKKSTGKVYNNDQAVIMSWLRKEIGELEAV